MTDLKTNKGGQTMTDQEKAMNAKAKNVNFIGYMQAKHENDIYMDTDYNRHKFAPIPYIHIFADHIVDYRKSKDEKRHNDTIGALQTMYNIPYRQAVKELCDYADELEEVPWI